MRVLSLLSFLLRGFIDEMAGSGLRNSSITFAVAAMPPFSKELGLFLILIF